MEKVTCCKSDGTAARKVGGAVGVEKSQWFVALVKNNTEKSAGEKLKSLGYEYYLPLQEEYHVWKTGKRAKVERVVIPTVIFVHCTEAVRREVVALPFIARFMTNKAASAAKSPIATIPEEQIDRLRFMLCNSDSAVTFSPTAYKSGDKVRVVRGKLQGLEGRVAALDAKHSEIVVNLDFLGSARLTIDTINVELVAPNP